LSGPGVFSGSKQGSNALTFKDGTIYEYAMDPICNVSGLLKGP
jgi:hypothetical protein